MHAQIVLFRKAELEMPRQTIMISVEDIQAQACHLASRHHVKELPAMVQDTPVIAPHKTGLVTSKVKARKMVKSRLVWHGKRVHRHMCRHMCPIAIKTLPIGRKDIVEVFGHIDECLEKRTIILIPENRGNISMPKA